MSNIIVFESYNAIPFSICILNKKREVLYINQSFKCNFKLIEKSVKQIKIEELFPIFKNDFLQLRLDMLFNDRLPIYMSSVLHGDSMNLNIKKEAYYNLNISSINGFDNDQVFAVLTIEEVTDLMNQISLQENFLEQLNIELKKTQEAKDLLLESEKLLLEANDAKNRLFSIIAHDLKSPFNALLGLTDILSNNSCLGYSCQLKEIHGSMGLAAQQGLDLVTNLLSWAQTQSNKIKAYPVKFDLSRIANEVKSYYSMAALKKGININYSCTGDCFAVFADPDMIKIILQNLISNAIKYTPSGGVIDIYIGLIDGIVKLDISDTGVGMSNEMIEKVLHARSIPSRKGTDLENGTGLGYLICNEFLENNNGVMDIRSKTNYGTTVSLLFKHKTK
nr:HAMP domain-containing sensor histidine kinase [uncultured Carboxylicivirga sp.]